MKRPTASGGSPDQVAIDPQLNANWGAPWVRCLQAAHRFSPEKPPPAFDPYIAKVMEITEETVRVHLHSAVATLRQSGRSSFRSSYMVQDSDLFQPACKDFEEDLILYYYGGYHEPESRTVKEHLRKCVSCGRFMEDLHTYLSLTGESTDLPQAFWNGYYKELMERLAATAEREPWWRGLFAFSYPCTVPALGTAIALIFVLTLTLGREMRHFRISSIQDVPLEIRAPGPTASQRQMSRPRLDPSRGK